MTLTNNRPLIFDNRVTDDCKVGINKKTGPEATLDVNGNTKIFGNTTISGIVNLNNTTTSTSSTTGALIVDGGVGIAENLNVGGTLNASVGQDISATFGYASIGYNGGDANHATFAHKDFMNGTDFALRQNSSGGTFINAKSGQSIYFRNGDNTTDTNEVFIKEGNMGISRTALTNTKLVIQQTDDKNDNSGRTPGNAIRIYREHDDTKYWGIGATKDEDDTDQFLVFRYDSSNKGGRINGSDHTITSMNNFTGQHRCLGNINISNNYIGLIVKTINKYINTDNIIIPTINESLPVIELINKDDCKSVFGVISDKEDDNDSSVYANGAFETFAKKTNINEQRLYINSLGEGAIWVCNKNGPLENGDYITSSSVTGYGMKQVDDLLHNYTVAKITCDCDFDLTKIVKQKVNTFIDASNEQNLVYDSNGNLEFVNDLDASGNVQMVYKYDTRFLDESGNEVEEGSHMYIACFVGCTYHCG